MLSKIIANEASAAFYEISGPEVFSKWYGASEEVLLRKIFTDAAKQERSIIFFDEGSTVSQRNVTTKGTRSQSGSSPSY